MIDNQKQVKALLQQMKKQLPIPVLATDGLGRSMKRELPELKRQRQLSMRAGRSSAPPDRLLTRSGGDVFEPGCFLSQRNLRYNPCMSIPLARGVN